MTYDEETSKTILAYHQIRKINESYESAGETKMYLNFWERRK